MSTKRQFSVIQIKRRIGLLSVGSSNREHAVRYTTSRSPRHKKWRGDHDPDTIKRFCVCRFWRTR